MRIDRETESYRQILAAVTIGVLTKQGSSWEDTDEEQAFIVDYTDTLWLKVKKRHARDREKSRETWVPPPEEPTEGSET